MKIDWNTLPNSWISRQALERQGLGPIPARQKVCVIEGMVYRVYDETKEQPPVGRSF